MIWPVPTLKPEWKTTFFNVDNDIDADDDDDDDVDDEVLFVLLSLLVSFVPANEVR